LGKEIGHQPADDPAKDQKDHKLCPCDNPQIVNAQLENRDNGIDRAIIHLADRPLDHLDRRIDQKAPCHHRDHRRQPIAESVVIAMPRPASGNDPARKKADQGIARHEPAKFRAFGKPRNDQIGGKRP
jgi:hypothetical protein